MHKLNKIYGLLNVHVM